MKNKNKNNLSPIQEATKNAKECFGKMRDVEFFSNRVKHLYFYGPVTRDSVLTLKMHIREANRDVALPSSASASADPVFVSPKPIVVHVNSFGGDAHSMQTIYSAFLESKMPICALVDGVSASAATILSAGAPYRVIAPSSASLFHEWTMSFSGMRKPDVQMRLTEMDIHDKGYNKAIQPKSKLSKDDLDSLVKRDLFLNAKQTHQKGFADRLLKFNHRTKSSPFSISTSNVREMLRDSGNNHVTILPSTITSESNEVDSVILELDRILQLDTDARKPTVVHFNQGYSEDVDQRMIHTFYGKMVPLLTRICACASEASEASGQVVGVVDSIIDVVSVIPFLYCDVRAMYESAIFVIHLVYGSSSVRMIDDDIENTKSAFAEVRKLLSERTKLPKKIVDQMHRTRIVMSAQQCLQYGIADVLL